MQADAIERLDLTRLLLEPEMLEAVEPDVHLVGTLLSLNRVMPERPSRPPARSSRKVVDDLERRIAQKTRTAVTGALNRAARINRPRHRDIDWNRTIRANLKHYQPEHAHRRAGAADRLRPADHGGAARRRALRRPVRLDGGLGRLQRSLRRGARRRCARCGPRWWSSTPPWST